MQILSPGTNNFTSRDKYSQMQFSATMQHDASVRSTLYASPPQLFVPGHSHILKVKFDKTLNLLHINPGAAGLQGWHKERTLVRLTIDGREFKDLEVITLNDK